jgi:putative hemolysin
MTIAWEIILLWLGLIGSAFFSGLETGLISLNRVRLRHEVERRNRRAMILNSFVENTDRLLGTTLIGNNLANVLLAVFSAALATRLFGPHYLVELLTTVVASAVVLVLGEIVPKTLFRRYPFRMCISMADLLNAAAWLFAPLVVVLGAIMRLIARIGQGAEPVRSFFVTREELKHLAREGEAGGAITAEERQMIHGVFDFPYKTVYEVMLPLGRAVTVARDTPARELLEISQRTGFARVPVRDGDQLVGVVNVYELLFDTCQLNGRVAEEMMRKPQFVLSTERINRVLPRLRAGRNPLSVVINPEGKHVGIVTVEDIVEEIVGDVEG